LILLLIIFRLFGVFGVRRICRYSLLLIIEEIRARRLSGSSFRSGGRVLVGVGVLYGAQEGWDVVYVSELV
jgi:hypothetical protein